MAPSAGVRALKAAQHRDAAIGDAHEVTHDTFRIQAVEHLGIVEADVFVNRHAVEPRAGIELRVAPIAGGKAARHTATDPDAEMVRLDSGHFAVEDKLDEVVGAINKFYANRVRFM